MYRTLTARMIHSLSFSLYFRSHWIVFKVRMQRKWEMNGEKSMMSNVDMRRDYENKSRFMVCMQVYGSKTFLSTRLTMQMSFDSRFYFFFFCFVLFLMEPCWNILSSHFNALRIRKTEKWIMVKWLQIQKRLN